jgi:hypothetical protein
MAMPASSIPMGPIILPTLLNVLVIGAGSEMCSRYSRAPAAMAIVGLSMICYTMGAEACAGLSMMCYTEGAEEKGGLSHFLL